MASIKNIFTPRADEDGAFFYSIKKDYKLQTKKYTVI